VIDKAHQSARENFEDTQGYDPVVLGKAFDVILQLSHSDIACSASQYLDKCQDIYLYCNNHALAYQALRIALHFFQTELTTCMQEYTQEIHECKPAQYNSQTEYTNALLTQVLKKYIDRQAREVLDILLTKMRFSTTTDNIQLTSQEYQHIAQAAQLVSQALQLMINQQETLHFLLSSADRQYLEGVLTMIQQSVNSKHTYTD